MLESSPENSLGQNCREKRQAEACGRKGTTPNLHHRRDTFCSPPELSLNTEGNASQLLVSKTDGTGPVKCSYNTRSFAGLLARSNKAQYFSNCAARRKKFPVCAASRAKIVDRFVALLNLFRHSEATLFRAVHLLDLYIARLGRRVERRAFQLASISALRLATKLEETRPIKLMAFLDKSVQEKFSKAELIDGEFEILRAIDFVVSAPTEVELLTAAFEPLGLAGPDCDQLRLSALQLARLSIFCLEMRGCFDPRQTAAFCIIYALRAQLGSAHADGAFSNLVS